MDQKVRQLENKGREYLESKGFVILDKLSLQAG